MKNISAATRAHVFFAVEKTNTIFFFTGKSQVPEKKPFHNLVGQLAQKKKGGHSTDPLSLSLSQPQVSSVLLCANIVIPVAIPCLMFNYYSY